MAQAAQLAQCLPRDLSFKHTVQLWISWSHLRHASHTDTMLDALFVLIAQQRVGKRPGRIEPRAVKRRAKPYPLLTKPRALAREDVRLHGHPKKVKYLSVNNVYVARHLPEANDRGGEHAQSQV